MKITFWGAAKQVTGSMHLLTLDNGYKILIDCGMNYEQKKELNETAFDFPFNPGDIDLVVLTHAHIDHSGNIPTIVNRGYKGQIICTEPTLELSKHLLFDSANIQMNEFKYLYNRAPKHRKKQVPRPIYLEREVAVAMDKVVTLPFNKKFKVADNISIELIEAGHLLGAASVVVEYEFEQRTTRIGFSGDLGRDHAELIRTPQPMKDLDYLICETTYGGRKHTSSELAEVEMMKYIEQTITKIGGRLVIPAFSVGRTQSIVHVLCRLAKKGLLPPVKVFVDSPLAIKSTHVYTKHPELLNSQATQFLNQHGDLFDFEGLKWIDNLDRHDQLLQYTDSCIIISAAGMVEGGRIQEHVKNNIQNPFSTILIAGFCAEGTLGHKLLSGQKHINIKGKEFTIYSTISRTDVFSSHPDKDEIFNYINACKTKKLKKIFLVHGDEPNLVAMQDTLVKAGIQGVEVPNMGEEFNLV
ncbi:MAG: MBL fold metallo-hydrolase [Bacteroidetes bacterium]|nr:MAG: MBL fold metallo-hydrolase [Bacteroidota bacterium]